MKIYSPSSTREESQGAPHKLKGVLDSLRQHERFPGVSVTTQEEPKSSRCNSRKTMRFPSQYKSVTVMKLASPPLIELHLTSHLIRCKRQRSHHFHFTDKEADSEGHPGLPINSRLSNSRLEGQSLGKFWACFQELSAPRGPPLLGLATLMQSHPSELWAGPTSHHCLLMGLWARDSASLRSVYLRKMG